MIAPAFAVHILTATGAGLALLALHAAAEQQWAMLFVWLGLALAVDGLDGPLARRLQVSERLPRWSGETLDLVVDFATYVFVPAYAIAEAGLMPRLWGLAAAFVIVVTGALYFARTDMKSEDQSFRGFPAVWNLVAFYLLMLRPSPLGVVLAIAALAALQFVSWRFVHPVRVRRWRLPTLALTAAWAALAALAVWQDLAPPLWVQIVLTVIAAYFLLVAAISARLR